MLFRNSFLAAVDSRDFASLSPHLREMSLDEGQTLSALGASLETIYFPSSSVIAAVADAGDDHWVEVSSVGNEGVAGLSPAIADRPASTRMTVRIGGGAMAMPAATFRETALGSARLLNLAHRFLQMDIERAELSAACWPSHLLPARLARWLLVSQDRVDKPVIHLTQDAIAMMTHALRGSISHVASEFREAGLIQYSRGQIEIVDRPRLEALACSCYRNDVRWRERNAL
ncbi:MAG TPA: Crp/Fnr family transcriptional regulator [Caulobacteraceae bacterium]|jgi:CRP-like cAMP-binding protein|nr:Crp/Fnr family transcriptional regulator [Caulobacteraceae bacterium]